MILLFSRNQVRATLSSLLVPEDALVLEGAHDGYEEEKEEEEEPPPPPPSAGYGPASLTNERQLYLNLFTCR